jgi:tRNA pseudouridine55 synthase
MNGFFLLKKEQGYSSNSVVQEIKKKIKVKKVGHLGTLDPMATGLLVLAVNRATKFSNYFLESDKSYDVEVELGCSTDTDDSTGNIIYQSNSIPDKASVKKELLLFKGESFQIPPFFSALKHKGKPLYKYARQGEYISKPPRKIFVKQISNFNFQNNICSFQIDCSKGTYIRSIARDLGERLGCGAHMKKLIRASQGIFSLSDATNSKDLKKENIIKIEDAFPNFSIINLSNDNLKKFINGLEINDIEEKEGLYRVFDLNNGFIGIGEIKDNVLKHKQLV